MSHGRPWTREEITELVNTVTRGGNTLRLGAILGRTHDAVIAKAKRLQLRFEPAVGEPAVAAAEMEPA